VSNVALLKNLYEAFGRGEMPTVLGAMSPDIRWHQAEHNPYNPSGDAWVGPEAIVNHLFVRLGAEWDGFDVQPSAFHDAGDTVVVEARYKGVYKSTGKRLDAQVCHVWDVKDGKIVRFQQYADTEQLNAVVATA
jgi:ketosteroid isomerase-like protein